MSTQPAPLPIDRLYEGIDLEIAVCAAWRSSAFPTPLRTVAGQTVEVIHRGRCTTQFQGGLVLRLTEAEVEALAAD